VRPLAPIIFSLLLLSCLAATCGAAYDLEVPPDPREEYRLQLKKYSQQLLKSYDRAFVDDYAGAIREVTLAIEILPDEGLAYAERAIYLRTLNNQPDAERDFRKALSLFDLAIQRYRPAKSVKKSKKDARTKVDPGEARLVATTRYQRGEAYFGFEQYRQAKDDFAAACKGGSAIACSRLQEVKLIEKRGLNWVPMSSLQFYDRQRVERPAPGVLRVWLLREERQPVRVDGAQEGSSQQHLELKCEAHEFRILDEPELSGSGAKSPAESETRFGQPVPGSAAGKLLLMLCPGPALK
jgi:tetratricopeptide (TPR) repeat protein